MGTRVDLYVGRGVNAEWLGSYPFDGYPEGMPTELLCAKTEKQFREAVEAYLVEGDKHSTRPEHGWPWPWETSATTDYAYAFDEGAVWGSCFGNAWWDASQPQPEYEGGEKVAVFPDMSSRKAATLGPRSGLIVMTEEGLM